MDLGTRWGGQPYAPAASTPGKKPVPIVQEAGWAPGPVWTGAENLAPPGFDPRTVQPVASRYTDYATRPIVSVKGGKNCGEGVEEGVGKRANTRQYKNAVISAALV